MKNILLITLFLLVCNYFNLSAQSIGINDTGSSPNASAMLHVQSTTKGFLMPRMTTAQRTAIPSPAFGLMVFDTDKQSFWYRNFTGQWIEMLNSTDEFFFKTTHGITTNESGIGVGEAPGTNHHKFVATDSVNNTVQMTLRNKHATGKSALYLLDPDAGIGGAFRFDNADRHLYIQNGQNGIPSGGDIIFRTNQVFESDNPNVEVMRIKRLGNVGIGTNDPMAKLHLRNFSNLTGLHIETNYDTPDTVYGIYNLIEPVGSGVHYGMYSKVEIDPSNTQDAFGVYGQVTNDGTGLHKGVFGRALGNDNIGVEGVSNGTGIGVKGVNTNNNGWAGYFDGEMYVEDRLDVRDKIALRPVGNASGGEIELYDDDGDETVTIRAGQSTSNGSEILMFSDANDLTVELDADGNGNAGEIMLSDEEGDHTVIIRAAQGSDNGAEMLMYNNAGVLTVEIDADFNAGKGRVITDELEITGGSDLAEHFDIISANKIFPGMIVSVDPSGSGKLVPTTKAYDTRVAGVVSGANGVSPGMLMGQKSSIADGDFPVALVGRVYVLADATKKPIVPGDLMTTSGTAGHAMAVTNHKKAQGAIIGKAITGLQQGTGYVLILVNLQ